MSHTCGGGSTPKPQEFVCHGAHIHRVLADVCTEAELFKSFTKETLMRIDAYLLIFFLKLHVCARVCGSQGTNLIMWALGAELSYQAW